MQGFHAAREDAAAKQRAEESRQNTAKSTRRSNREPSDYKLEWVFWSNLLVGISFRWISKKKNNWETDSADLVIDYLKKPFLIVPSWWLEK